MISLVRVGFSSKQQIGFNWNDFVPNVAKNMTDRININQMYKYIYSLFCRAPRPLKSWANSLDMPQCMVPIYNSGSCLRETQSSKGFVLPTWHLPPDNLRIRVDTSERIGLWENVKWAAGHFRFIVSEV
jgi:hypothetical protein